MSQSAMSMCASRSSSVAFYCRMGLTVMPRWGVFGQLEILVHQAGADDGGFLGLNQGNRHPRMLEQEVFAEKSL